MDWSGNVSGKMIKRQESEGGVCQRRSAMLAEAQEEDNLNGVGSIKSFGRRI